MKSIKTTFIFLTIAVFTASLMTGCSKKEAATASLNLNNISITTETVKVIDADYHEEETQEDNNSSSDNSGSGSKSNGSVANRNTSNSGSKSSGNSNKASGSSSDKSSGGNSSSSGGSSGNSSEDKKPEEPAQKNVSAKEVQAQVNSYIKSKGITVDSSMTSGNASWTSTCWIDQDDLNSGYCLKSLKGGVDYTIKMCGKDTILSMYCYYDNSQFYICYW